MATNNLTAEQARHFFKYDPETGIFTWAVSRQGVVLGAVAGFTDKDGYRFICISRRHYPAHRIAWLHYYGEWPKQVIDHINGVKTDNRIFNLRDVPNSVNLQNQRVARSRNKASGLLGVFKSNSRWRSRVQIGDIRHNLGSFATAEEAHAAYITAKRLIHPGCTI